MTGRVCQLGRRHSGISCSGSFYVVEWCEQAWSWVGGSPRDVAGPNNVVRAILWTAALFLVREMYHFGIVYRIQFILSGILLFWRRARWQGSRFDGGSGDLRDEYGIPADFATYSRK